MHFSRKLPDGNIIKTKKDIRIYSEFDRSGAIVRCLGLLDAVQQEVVDEALEDMCVSMGGAFNMLTKYCI